MAVVGPVLSAYARLESNGRPARHFPIRVRQVAGAPTVDVLVDLGEAGTDALGALVSAVGFVHGAVHRRHATGFLPISAIPALEDLAGDAYIEAAALVVPELDRTVPEAWGPTTPRPVGLTGAGVVVGIVDLGFDLGHPCLRHAGGATRVLRLWDQRLDPTDPGEASPQPYNYGVEWDRAAIDADLGGTLPLGWTAPLTRHSPRSHGTAVAGVAAGNGLAAPAGRYIGMAPEADLILVAVDAPGLVLASSRNLIDAVTYVFEQVEALGLRAVVNVSMGAWRGPHDSSGLLEANLQAVLDADDNRIVVKSAGNTADQGVHAEVVVGSGQGAVMELDVPKLAGRAILVQLWYRRGDRVEVRVIDPNGTSTPSVATNQRITTNLTSDVADVEHLENCAENGQNVVTISLIARTAGVDVLAGVWRIEITGTHVQSAASVHGWVDRTARQQPSFRAPARSDDCTATAPSATSEVLAVGAYDSSTSPGPLRASSGRGPMRDGADLRLLVAPGTSVSAPTPGTAGPYAAVAGTSFAAPHATGGIALLLQAVPLATRADVLGCLQKTVRTDPSTAAGPVTAWGWGRLDVGAALRCLQAGSTAGDDVSDQEDDP